MCVLLGSCRQSLEVMLMMIATTTTPPANESPIHSYWFHARLPSTTSAPPFQSPPQPTRTMMTMVIYVRPCIATRTRLDWLPSSRILPQHERQIEEDASYICLHSKKNRLIWRLLIPSRSLWWWCWSLLRTEEQSQGQQLLPWWVFLIMNRYVTFMQIPVFEPQWPCRYRPIIPCPVSFFQPFYSYYHR